MKNSITQDFVDENGKQNEMIITSDSQEKVELKSNYKLQRPESNNKYMKKGAKGKSIFTTAIGHKSEGFGPIFTLAVIISISVIIVAYLMWRF